MIISPYDISFSRSLLYEINMNFYSRSIILPKLLLQKYMFSVKRYRCKGVKCRACEFFSAFFPGFMFTIICFILYVASFISLLLYVASFMIYKEMPSDFNGYSNKYLYVLCLKMNLFKIF